MFSRMLLWLNDFLCIYYECTPHRLANILLDEIVLNGLSSARINFDTVEGLGGKVLWRDLVLGHRFSCLQIWHHSGGLTNCSQNNPQRQTQCKWNRLSSVNWNVGIGATENHTQWNKHLRHLTGNPFSVFIHIRRVPKLLRYECTPIIWSLTLTHTSCRCWAIMDYVLQIIKHV